MTISDFYFPFSVSAAFDKDIKFRKGIEARSVIKDQSAICLNKQEKVHIAQLSGSRIEKLKEPARDPKPAAIWLRTLRWLGDTQCGHQVIFKGIRLLRWLGDSSSNAKNLKDAQLNHLSGSPHASKMLHGLSPWIAGMIKEKFLAIKSPLIIREYLMQEPNALNAFVDTLVPHLYCNIAQSIKESRSGISKKRKPVMLVDVVSCLCGIVSKHLSRIQKHLESIDNIPEGEQRNKIIREAFTEIVQEFLSVALPKGIRDLPLPFIPNLSQYIWRTVQKHILPMIAYELYRQMAFPMRAESKMELLQKRGGESLVSLAQVVGRQSAELLPSLLVSKRLSEQSIAASPTTAAIVKSICSFLTGSEQLKKWIAPWLTTQVSLFAAYEDNHLPHLWKLLGGYCEPLVIHIFTHMSQLSSSPTIETVGKTPDAVGVIAIRLLSVCSHFINSRRTLIQERLDRLRCIGRNPKDDQELLHLFHPLAQELLQLMGLDQPANLPVPDFVKELLARQLKEMAPGFLVEQYCAIVDSKVDDQDIGTQLRTLLFDPRYLEDPKVAVDVISSVHKNHGVSANEFSHVFYENLWRASGTANLVLTLEEICTKMASGLVESSMRHLGVAYQSFLADDKNPMIHELNVRLKAIVKTAFLEILAHMISRVEERVPKESDQHPKSLIAINALFQLHAIAHRRLRGITKALCEVAQKYPKGSESYLEETNKLFRGLAADLHEFIGVNPFKNLPIEGLPGGDTLKEVLWKTVKTSLLPAWLCQVYCELTEWQSKTDMLYEELEDAYHSSHPKWVCKVLAQYATDFIRHYLLHSNEETAKLIVEGLGLKELKNNGEYFISQNIRAVEASEDPQFATIWPAITQYAEAIFAKVFGGISQTIQRIELDHPDVTVDAAIQILKDTADHFAIVTKVTEELGVDQSYQVPSADMLAAFREHLHPGVPVKPSDPANMKDQVRLQGFFIPLANKLLKLANISVGDLPIPSSIRQPIGELILNKIFPLILMRCYQKACEPQVRNVLMLHFVQTLYVALNGVKPPKKDHELQEATSYLSPKQQHLYETCGSVVLELVKLIPDTAVQYVFMKEKVKNMSAQAIGNAIMPYLSRWSLLQMIDSIIYSGLPNFHPAKWEGKQGREEFVPRKISVRPDGKMELKPVKDFKFHFTPASNEMNRYEQQKAQEAAKLRRELRDGFTRTISQQLYEKLWAFIQSLWDTMQGQLNDFIETTFPDKGREAKAALDKIFRKLFFDILGTILGFLTTPATALGKYAIEKIIIDRRSEDIIENLQSEVLENLFYKWTDSVIDGLVRLRN